MQLLGNGILLVVLPFQCTESLSLSGIRVRNWEIPEQGVCAIVDPNPPVGF